MAGNITEIVLSDTIIKALVADGVLVSAGEHPVDGSKIWHLSESGRKGLNFRAYDRNTPKNPYGDFEIVEEFLKPQRVYCRVGEVVVDSDDVSQHPWGLTINGDEVDVTLAQISWESGVWTVRVDHMINPRDMASKVRLDNFTADGTDNNE